MLVDEFSRIILPFITMHIIAGELSNFTSQPAIPDEFDSARRADFGSPASHFG
jgi:hypothetical protein